MRSNQLSRIQVYLERNARAVDLAMYNFHFGDGSALDVINELKKYQNSDGGFGRALEPDLRLPLSTALATWAAFRIMDEVGIDAKNEILQHGLSYLIDSYDSKRAGWAIVRPEADDYPHAPWWGYKTAMADFGWGNPSAELLGFLIKYGGTKTAGLVSEMSQQAVAKIQEVKPSDFHEVFNFKALYELAGEDLRAQLKDPLERLTVKSANTNPEEWHEYTAPPLKFISSPADPFARLFDAEIIAKNLEFLVSTMANGDHWEPNWDWGGAYPKDWQLAKKEWSGQLTVKNLLILKARWNFSQN